MPGEEVADFGVDFDYFGGKLDVVFCGRVGVRRVGLW